MGAGVSQGIPARTCPTTPARSRAAGGTGAATAMVTRHLLGDRDGPMLGWDVGLQMDPAQQGPWLGRAGLWGAGDGPCCSIAGAGADSPGWLK